VPGRPRRQNNHLSSRSQRPTCRSQQPLTRRKRVRLLRWVRRLRRAGGRRRCTSPMRRNG
jgi:hypothetical protein